MSAAPARRIIVVSPDDELGQRLASGLRELGEVELAPRWQACVAGPAVALWLIHLCEPEPPLPSGAPIIVVAPGQGLAAILRYLQGAPDVAAVIASAALEPRALAALAARVITGEPTGIAPVMVAGTPVAVRRVGDHRGKQRCLAAIRAAVERTPVPSAQRAALEQLVDELVSNALYDAPLDAEGRPLFAGVAPRARRSLRTDREVVVQHAWDGERFAIAVRDAFGALERATVLSHLDKGLHAAQPVDRKVGGAGLGLYLVVHAATAVWFHVVPGVATEAVCVFELAAPAGALAQLGVVHSDPAGRPRTGPARRLPVRSSGRRAALAVGGAVLAVGAAAVVGQRGHAVDAAAPIVELDSRPPGAAVTLDGALAGATPLTVTTAAPGSTVVLVFRHPGYRPATRQLVIPPAGERSQLIQPLEPADDVVLVRFASRPAGAAIIETGQPLTTDRTYTPAELWVTAGQEHRFTLTMPGHVPLEIEPFTPARGAPALDKGGDLVEGATLRVEASLDGKASVDGAPHCRAAALPLDCVLAPGRYTVAYVGPDRATFTRAVTMADSDAAVRFALGVIEAAPGKLLEPGKLRRQVVEAGAHTVSVADRAGSHRVVVTVEAGATVSVD